MTKSMMLGEMMAELARVEMAELIAMEAGLDACAAAIQKTAKAKFGEYQDDVGEFPAWAELAESTQEERGRLGYTENDPLLRSGALKGTIQRETHGLEAVIGSKDDVMLYHEVGTSKMPPRPVLGPAAIENEAKIEEVMAGALLAGFVGAEVAHNALGYEYAAVAESEPSGG